MKLTKSQLTQLIKEEIMEAMVPDDLDESQLGSAMKQAAEEGRQRSIAKLVKQLIKLTRGHDNAIRAIKGHPLK